MKFHFPISFRDCAYAYLSFAVRTTSSTCDIFCQGFRTIPEPNISFAIDRSTQLTIGGLERIIEPDCTSSLQRMVNCHLHALA